MRINDLWVAVSLVSGTCIGDPGVNKSHGRKGDIAMKCIGKEYKHFNNILSKF